MTTSKICTHCEKKPKAPSRQVCYKCNSILWRQNNFHRATYLNLKNNAKRREKDFELTFEQFLQFCLDTDYIIGKGKHKDSLHIDRIDEEKGYTIDNIQVLTNTLNVKKQLKFRYNPTGCHTFDVERLGMKSYSSAAPF